MIFIILNLSSIMTFVCVYCSIECRRGDRTLTCYLCGRWSHVLCVTGTSEDMYRAMADGRVISWSCRACPTNHVEVPALNLTSHVPVRIDEQEEADVDVVGVSDDDEEVTYELVKGGTQRNCDLLTDSRGHMYLRQTRKRTHHAVHWKCRFSKKTKICNASVVECDTGYNRVPVRHAFKHTCQPDFEKVKVAKMRNPEVKRGTYQ